MGVSNTHFLQSAVFRVCIFGFVAVGAAAVVSPSLVNAKPQSRLSVSTPMIDPAEGARLFAAKGCVVCHAVNGVGGKAAPPLDASEGSNRVDVADFAARMWRGAYAMTELQAIEFGYQIELDGSDIAHLAAFAADVESQKRFSVEDVPDPMRTWFLDEPYWLDQDWAEQLREENWPPIDGQ
ncbi:MAG: c-type cytochrome [Pseudomonadota bacterium]